MFVCGTGGETDGSKGTTRDEVPDCEQCTIFTDVRSLRIPSRLATAVSLSQYGLRLPRVGGSPMDAHRGFSGEEHGARRGGWGMGRDRADGSSTASGGRVVGITELGSSSGEKAKK